MTFLRSSAGFASTACLPFLIALLTACASDAPGGVTGIASEGVVVIDDEAVVFDAETVRLPLGGHEDLLALDTSHVVASAVRGGFLRHVRSVEAVGDEVVITTAPAELGDAVVEMRLRERLIERGGQLSDSAEGSVGAAREALEVAEFRTVFGPQRVHEGLSMDVDVEGQLDFDPALDFELDVHDRRVDHLLLRAAGDLQADLHVHVDVRADNQSLGYSHELWKWERPFFHFIGPVPVVEVVTLELGVGVGLEVDGNLVVDIGGGIDSTVALGTVLEDGEWSDIGERTFEIRDARASVSGSGSLAAVQMFVYAKLSVMLYDVAGPYVHVQPNVRMVRDDGWHLGTVGVYGEVGIDAQVPVIGSALGVWDRQLFDVGLVFHESETSEALMTPPEPPPPASSCGEVPPQGSCLAGVLTDCVDGEVVVRDCAIEGLGCGFAHGEDRFACVEGCGDVDGGGACHGASLRYCRAGALNVVECGARCERPDERSPAYCM
ncbi:MAG: hypothetical protein EVA89_21430 [Sandaracinaceae bacterium]|nr:MAG: hypothetical protein EVA89_21430 [Sandaracinaceae bacterium]